MESKFILNNNNYITYKYIENSSNKDYIIVYLHGFTSNMDNEQGIMLEKICKQYNINLLKLNYLGHGTSSGKFTDFIMSDWFDNIKTIIDNFSNDKKMIFVGHSLGSWFAYLMALEYKNRLKGIVTFATGVDYMTRYVEKNIKEEDKNKEIVYELTNKDGKKNGAYVTRKMWLDSKNFNLFDKNITFDCPIIMVHGLNDKLIPYELPIDFAKILNVNDLEILLVKNMNHSLSLDGNLNIFKDTIIRIIKKVDINI